MFDALTVCDEVTTAVHSAMQIRFCADLLRRFVTADGAVRLQAVTSTHLFALREL